MWRANLGVIGNLAVMVRIITAVVLCDPKGANDFIFGGGLIGILRYPDVDGEGTKGPRDPGARNALVIAWRRSFGCQRAPEGLSDEAIARGASGATTYTGWASGRAA